MNYLVLCDDLTLIREWVAANPDASAWFYGKKLPRSIDGLEGQVLSNALTLKEAKAFGEFDEIVELPQKPAKKTTKKAVEKDE